LAGSRLQTPNAVPRNSKDFREALARIPATCRFRSSRLIRPGAVLRLDIRGAFPTLLNLIGRWET
jgi:hypothetical protein